MQTMIKSKNRLCIYMGLVLMVFSPSLFSEETAAPIEETTITTEETAAPTEESSAPPVETSTATTAESTPAKSEHIVRALLTTSIENREPVDEIVSLNKNQERIYFFTEFAGLKGKMIKHRWEYKGKSMGEVNFNVGSNKWRCYSSKNLLPEWTGIWTVSVIDENEQVLTETYFEITE